MMQTSTISGKLARCLRCSIVFGAVLVAACGVARAATDPWATLGATVFTHVARDGEIPNSAIPHALTQDAAGFLWIATDDGLARWDGYAFRVYKPDPAIPGSLPDGIVDALYTDSRGRLWIGTNSAGLVRYDADNDRFVLARRSARKLPAGAVDSIADDGRGGLFVASGGRLSHLDGTGEPIDPARSNDAPGLPQGVRAILRDRSGTLWAGTSSGLFRRPSGAPRFSPVPLSGSRPNVDVWVLLADDTGKVWVGTRGSGAFVVVGRSGRARALRAGSDDQTDLGSESILTIAQASPQEVWLGTSDAGIVAFDIATGRAKRIRHEPDIASSLPNDTVMALYRDRSGLLWAATVRSLSYCDARRSGIVTVFAPNPRAGLADANVHAVLARPNGRVWLGLGKSGAAAIDPLSGRSTRVPLMTTNAGLGNGGVRTLAESSDGGVLLGGRDGLFRSRSETDPARRVDTPSAAGGTRAILEQSGQTWFGGTAGLWRLDRRGVVSLRLATALTDVRVTAIEPGPSGRLWIGTENGLNRFDPASGRIVRIFPDAADPHGLSSALVSTLLTDERGRLWVGTQGGGIDILEPGSADSRPRFVRLGETQGLPNEDVDKLLVDGRGDVWASTDDGLAMIDEQTLAVRTFRVAQGVGISGYWANSGSSTASGELIFGGLGGLTVVEPRRVALRHYAAPVVVTDIRVAGRPLPATRYNAGGDIPAVPIGPDANSFAVEFAALDYTAPERNRYAYRLDGFDAGWVEVDANRRFAAYTNLPPGNYRLLLRGSNHDGDWSSTMVLPIRVAAAWYQMAGFQVLEAVAALGLVALLVVLRTALLRRRQRELEREVAARTAELHAAQRKLEALAYFDTLTGLPNRRTFSEDFRRLIAASRRDGNSFAVALLDLDGFKAINDSLGHDAGDTVLVEAAARIRAVVRESDCTARLGGDEFAVLLGADCAVEDVDRICARLVASLAEPVAVRGTPASIGTSVGIARFPHDGTDWEALYHCADLALYAAKRAGRGTWRWYRGELPV